MYAAKLHRSLASWAAIRQAPLSAFTSYEKVVLQLLSQDKPHKNRRLGAHRAAPMIERELVETGWAYRAVQTNQLSIRDGAGEVWARYST